MARFRGTDGGGHGGSRSGSGSTSRSRSSRRSRSLPADHTVKPPANATGKEAGKKIIADDLKALGPIKKGPTTTSKDKSKTTAAQKTARARQMKRKGRDPTPPLPPTPPKKNSGKKSTTTAAGSKTKGGRVKKSGQKDTVTAEEARSLGNHTRCLASLINRISANDRGAWTGNIGELRIIDTRLRQIQRGTEFTRQSPEFKGPDEETEEDPDPPSKKGRKTAGSKKK